MRRGDDRARGHADRIRVLRGRGADVLPGLDEPYDLIFSNGDPEEMPLDLEHFLRLLRPGGLLISESLPRSVRSRSGRR
jgi:predicted O-methyltransferase YrrM